MYFPLLSLLFLKFQALILKWNLQSWDKWLENWNSPLHLNKRVTHILNVLFADYHIWLSDVVKWVHRIYFLRKETDERKNTESVNSSCFLRDELLDAFPSLSTFLCPLHIVDARWYLLIKQIFHIKNILHMLKLF